MPRKFIRILVLLLCSFLIFEQSGFAQVAGQLDISAHILSLRNSLIQDKFRPLHLRSLSYDNLNNKFQLLLDKGDSKDLEPNTIEQTTKELLNYFFVGITLPNDSFWVNLRPDSPDNIIDPALAVTDVGRILLEADLQLKKDTAKFTSPETVEGKKYWDKLYQKAGEIFGTSNITIPTLTRPWIVPGEIIIREAEDNAYIYKANLKVCLEQDYLKGSATYNFKDERLKQLNEYSSQLIREFIIPKLTKEVNNAKRYTSLRQVYYSLILAQWFKQKFYGKSGLYSWLIDKQNLNGLTSKTSWSKNTYFKAYQQSFKDGEYNIQEPVSSIFGRGIRTYFSGGINFVTNVMLAPITGGAIQGNPTKSRPIVNPKIIGIEIKGSRDVGNPSNIELGKIEVTEEGRSVGYGNTDSGLNQLKSKATEGEGKQKEKQIIFTPVVEVSVAELDEGQIIFELANNPSPERRAQLMARLNEIKAAASTGSDSEVILSAGKNKRLKHNNIHNAIEEGLPEDLKGFSGKSRDEQKEILEKYRNADGQIVIPIKGLLRNTGLLGHIGLGQYYGEPVIYIEADLNKNERKDVEAHELYEIAKWEAKRKELGLNYTEMRAWIRKNSNKEGTGLAQQLAKQWHNEAPSVEHIFEKWRKNQEEDEHCRRRWWQFQQGRVERIGARVFEAAKNNAEEFKKLFKEKSGMDLGDIEETSFTIESKADFLAVGREDEGARILLDLAVMLSDGELSWVLAHEFNHIQQNMQKQKIQERFMAEYDMKKQKREIPEIPRQKIEELPEHLNLNNIRERLSKLSLKDWFRLSPSLKETLEQESQSSENLADEMGVFLTAKSGFDPVAAQTAFKKVIELTSPNLLPREKRDYQTHPEHNIRIQSIAGYALTYEAVATDDIYEEKDVVLGAGENKKGGIDGSIGSPSIPRPGTPRRREINGKFESSVISSTEPSPASQEMLGQEIEAKSAKIRMLEQEATTQPLKFEGEDQSAKELKALKEELSDLRSKLEGIKWEELNGIPPVREGYVRLYRGANKFGDNNLTFEEWAKDGRGSFETAGEWFSSKFSMARVYADYSGPNGLIGYIDVPSSEVGKYSIAGQFENGTKGSEFETFEYVVPKNVQAELGGIKVPQPQIRSPVIPSAEKKYEADRDGIDGSVSSASITQEAKKGGIDFRSLSIVTQPMQPLLGTAPLNRQDIALAGIVPTANIDKKWQEIQNMLNAGMIPSNERIKEYLQESLQKQDFSQDIDKILSCIADILRLEEEYCLSADAALKEFLVLLESDKQINELQIALVKIDVLSQEPKQIIQR